MKAQQPGELSSDLDTHSEICVLCQPARHPVCCRDLSHDLCRQGLLWHPTLRGLRTSGGTPVIPCGPLQVTKLQSPESRGRRGFWITEVTGKDAEPARCSRVTLPWDWLRLSIKRGDKVDRRSCRSSAQSQGHGGHRVQGTAFSLLILNALLRCPLKGPAPACGTSEDSFTTTGGHRASAAHTSTESPFTECDSRGRRLPSWKERRCRDTRGRCWRHVPFGVPSFGQSSPRPVCTPQSAPLEAEPNWP